MPLFDLHQIAVHSHESMRKIADRYGLRRVLIVIGTVIDLRDMIDVKKLATILQYPFRT